MVEMCSKHLLERPIPPSERLGKHLSMDLETLVLACLAKNREDRPSSAVAFRAALLGCKDAKDYAPLVARAWWHNRGAELRTSRRSAVRSGPSAPRTVMVSRFSEHPLKLKRT